ERQLDLFLPLTGAGTGFLAQGVPAMRTADSGDVMFGLAVLGRDWGPAGVALFEIAFAQIVPYGDPVVEHEAVALPADFGLGHFFQVFQDAALEVVDLLETLAEHVARRLLAAD